jgi:hypothetical protein
MCGCVVVWVCVGVGVYTKSKTSELSPLRRKLLRFAKQFPPPLRSNYYDIKSRTSVNFDIISQKYHLLSKKKDSKFWTFCR